MLKTKKTLAMILALAMVLSIVPMMVSADVDYEVDFDVEDTYDVVDFETYDIEDAYDVVEIMDIAEFNFEPLDDFVIHSRHFYDLGDVVRGGRSAATFPVPAMILTAPTGAVRWEGGIPYPFSSHSTHWGPTTGDYRNWGMSLHILDNASFGQRDLTTVLSFTYDGVRRFYEMTFRVNVVAEITAPTVPMPTLASRSAAGVRMAPCSAPPGWETHWRGRVIGADGTPAGWGSWVRTTFTWATMGATPYREVQLRFAPSNPALSMREGPIYRFAVTRDVAVEGSVVFHLGTVQRGGTATWTTSVCGTWQFVRGTTGAWSWLGGENPYPLATNGVNFNQQPTGFLHPLGVSPRIRDDATLGHHVATAIGSFTVNGVRQHWHMTYIMYVVDTTAGFTGTLNFGTVSGARSAALFVLTPQGGGAEIELASVVRSGAPFTLTNVPDGTYTMQIIMGGHQTHTVNNVFVGGGAMAALGNITLTATGGTGSQFRAGDLTGDGSVGAADLMLMLQFVNGMISRFPVEDM